MARLHLFPNADIPAELKENITDQIKQVQLVYKPVKDYDKDVLDKFPKIVDYDQDFVIK